MFLNCLLNFYYSIIKQANIIFKTVGKILCFRLILICQKIHKIKLINTLDSDRIIYISYLSLTQILVFALAGSRYWSNLEDSSGKFGKSQIISHTNILSQCSEITITAYFIDIDQIQLKATPRTNESQRICIIPRQVQQYSNFLYRLQSNITKNNFFPYIARSAPFLFRPFKFVLLSEISIYLSQGIRKSIIENIRKQVRAQFLSPHHLVNLEELYFDKFSVSTICNLQSSQTSSTIEFNMKHFNFLNDHSILSNSMQMMYCIDYFFQIPKSCLIYVWLPQLINKSQTDSPQSFRIALKGDFRDSELESQYQDYQMLLLCSTFFAFKISDLDYDNPVYLDLQQIIMHFFLSNLKPENRMQSKFVKGIKQTFRSDRNIYKSMNQCLNFNFLILYDKQNTHIKSKLTCCLIRVRSRMIETQKYRSPLFRRKFDGQMTRKGQSRIQIL